MAGRPLLCTDGLWRYPPDAARLRAAPGRHDPEARTDARAPVGHTMEAGCRADVTAAVIRVVPSPPGR